MWIDLMIDLETMGLPPDGAVVSIGACFFDLDALTIGPTFKKNVNLATAVRDGGTLTPSTIMWWMGQGDEARKSVLYDTYDVRQVLQELSDFIAEHSRHQDVRVWGNGADFDVTIMNSAYLRAGMKTPWGPFRVRCFRTVRNMYPSVEYNTDEKGDGAHNALTDAIFQALHLFKIKNRNKTHA
ncbi:MAG: 3'-5' exonuclease [bacterium]|jgi:DNA polymerase III epsilon subunit-like protein